jgi:hypothetical protein
MGCDYYIYKYLKINFGCIFPIYIQLEKDRGYFDFNLDLDEDDPDYNKKYKKYVKETLTPNMKPIIIYEKNEFVNSNLENTYKLLVNEELNRYNRSQAINIDWKDILHIKMIETREERD